MQQDYALQRCNLTGLTRDGPNVHCIYISYSKADFFPPVLFWAIFIASSLEKHLELLKV